MVTRITMGCVVVVLHIFLGDTAQLLLPLFIASFPSSSTSILSTPYSLNA